MSRRFRTDIAFIVAGACALCVGTVFGIMIRILQNYAIMPVHAHMNVVGWASLMIFGLFYKAYPELGLTKIAKTQLIISSVSAYLLPLGMWFEMTGGTKALVAIAALAWALGTLLFALTAFRLLRLPRTA